MRLRLCSHGVKRMLEIHANFKGETQVFTPFFFDALSFQKCTKLRINKIHAKLNAFLQSLLTLYCKITPVKTLYARHALACVV